MSVCKREIEKMSYETKRKNIFLVFLTPQSINVRRTQKFFPLIGRNDMICLIYHSMKHVHLNLIDLACTKTLHDSQKYLELNTLWIGMIPTNPFVRDKDNVSIEGKILPLYELSSMF